MTAWRAFCVSIALCVAGPANAQPRRAVVHGIGAEISERGKLGLPLARCAWKTRYRETLAFTDNLDRGMPRSEAAKALASLEAACIDPAKPDLRGDVVEAMIQLRNEAVSACLMAHEPTVYRAWIRTMKRAQNTPLGKAFYADGFPASLAEAIDDCDPSLQRSYRLEYRDAFAVDVLGWSWRQ